METASNLNTGYLSSDLPPSDELKLEPAPSLPKQRNRLTAEGVAILDEYWLRNPNPLQLPPLDDRKRLTTVIKDLPGCAHWNGQKTADWFKRRMKKLQAHSTHPLVPPQDALQHLGVLLKSQPNPSPDVIGTWATLLAREKGPTVVQFWIGYITNTLRNSQVPNGSSHPPFADLPTPAGTVTPEPQNPYGLISQPRRASSSYLPPNIKHDPADSPIIPPLAIRTQSAEASPLSPSTTDFKSPVSPIFSTEQSRRRPSLRDMIDEALSSNPTESDGPLPNNADEFIEMFAPYEIKLRKLQRILEK